MLSSLSHFKICFSSIHFKDIRFYCKLVKFLSNELGRFEFYVCLFTFFRVTVHLVLQVCASDEFFGICNDDYGFD